MRRKKQKRQDEIRILLSSHDSLRNTEIARILNVTPETIRKDLDDLENQQLIVREHGYARLNKGSFEIPLELRQQENSQLKERIAVRAIQDIQDGQTVFLDAGSTLLQGIDLLSSKRDLTIVVNSIPVALEALRQNFKVIFLGGVLLKNGQRTEGFFASNMIDRIHIDYAILGTSGIRGARGFGVCSEAEIESRRRLLKHSDRVAVIMDSSKFDVPASYQFCSFSEIDLLITNELSDEQREIVRDVPQVLEV